MFYTIVYQILMSKKIISQPFNEFRVHQKIRRLNKTFSHSAEYRNVL